MSVTVSQGCHRHLEERTAVSKPQYKGEIYRDVRGEFRWRVRASNGRIVADSSEGYVDRNVCSRTLSMLCRVAEVVDLVELPDEA
jgi:uncharacterized protein YegP (UPF0339 family)